MEWIKKIFSEDFKDENRESVPEDHEEIWDDNDEGLEWGWGSKDEDEGEFREFRYEDESEWVIQFESDAMHSWRDAWDAPIVQNFFQTRPDNVNYWQSLLEKGRVKVENSQFHVMMMKYAQ